MNGFFSKKTVVIILIAVLISLMLAILSAVSGGRISPIGSLINIVSAPVQRVSESVTEFFSARTERALEFDRLKEENRQLREELAVLRRAMRENSAMGLENEQLRAALAKRADCLSLRNSRLDKQNAGKI